MTTFALIHGAYHGAWCWDRLVPEIESRGHRAIAMDMPSENRRAGAREYAAAALAAIGDAQDVVVVGHSIGGLTVPMVASMRAVRGIALVAAMHPVPGRSFDETAELEPELFGSHIAYGEKVTGSDGVTRWEEPEDAIPVFFHDCAPSDALWAASMLRGQTWHVSQEETPLERWPDTETLVVACMDEGARLAPSSPAIAAGALRCRGLLDDDHEPRQGRRLHRCRTDRRIDRDPSRPRHHPPADSPRDLGVCQVLAIPG